MTKKDYEAIARAIKDTTQDYLGRADIDPEAFAADIAWALADNMQADNPQFDRARFLQACAL